MESVHLLFCVASGDLCQLQKARERATVDGKYISLNFVKQVLKKGNAYLLETAVSKLILFGGRLILNHNEMLYPYHKWFLKVLERANDKPADLMTCIQALATLPTAENIEAFYEKIKTSSIGRIALTACLPSLCSIAS